MCGDARIAQIRACRGSQALLAIVLALVASLLAPAAPAAADWYGPTFLSPPGAEVRFPTLAVNAAGDAAALSWDDRDGGRLVLSRRPAGGQWSGPLPVLVPVLCWYLTSGGTRRQVRTVVRAPSARVRDAFPTQGRHGTLTASLQRAGRVVAQVSVTLR
jgi:hypothetical protein